MLAVLKIPYPENKNPRPAGGDFLYSGILFPVFHLRSFIFGLLFIIRNVVPVPFVAQGLDLSGEFLQILVGAAFVLPDHRHQPLAHRNQFLKGAGSLAGFMGSGFFFLRYRLYMDSEKINPDTKNT